jgi:hypothetical protein
MNRLRLPNGNLQNRARPDMQPMKLALPKPGDGQAYGFVQRRGGNLDGMGDAFMSVYETRQQRDCDTAPL